MKANKLKPVAAALLASGLIAAVQAAPATPSATIQEEVTYAPHRTVSPSEQDAISSAAAKVLRHIAQARADLHDKDTDGARTQLSKAETLLDIIQASLPTTEVKDRIWVAKKHLEYEDSEEVLPDLVPIYTSLDELVDFMPVKEAKQHLDKAKNHLKQGKKQSAIEELDATDAALVYVEADLPLTTTRHLIARAKDDLDGGATDAADKALKSAEDNVVFLSVDVDEPLVPAKSSLWRALQAYSGKAYDTAKQELANAVQYLERAAHSTDATVRNESGSLLTEAKTLQGKLASHDEAARSGLERLWRRTQALTERSIEYLGNGWSQARTDSTLKSDLIEAKLHTDYARIEQFTADNPKQADRELTQAVNYLDQALKQADIYFTDQSIKNRVSNLQTTLHTIENLPAAQRSEAAFAQAQRDMQGLIGLL